MGYDFHVTRRRNYFDAEGPRIAPDEWQALVASDPELTFDDPQNPLLASWNCESRYPDPWFEYFEGNIKTKNPDPPIIAKMLKIAAELKAKVQGDHGEVYRSPTETFLDDAGQSVRRPWWRRLLGG